MDSEIWKNIEGFNGLYEISSLGRVKSNSRKPRILKPGTNPQGYKQVSLGKNWKFNSFRLNRLVAKAFIPNSHNKPEVNHINGIKSDNRAENLEWVTSSENSKHAFKLGLKKMDGLCAEKRVEALQKLLNKPIINIITNKTYPSIKKAAIDIGVTYSHLSQALRGIINNKTNLRYKN